MAVLDINKREIKIGSLVTPKKYEGRVDNSDVPRVVVSLPSSSDMFVRVWCPVFGRESEGWYPESLAVVEGWEDDN